MRRKQKAIRVVSRPLPQPQDLNFAHRICSVAKSPLKLRSVAQLTALVSDPVSSAGTGSGQRLDHARHRIPGAVNTRVACL